MLVLVQFYVCGNWIRNLSSTTANHRLAHLSHSSSTAAGKFHFHITMASATPARSPFSAAPSPSRRRRSQPHHQIILSPLTVKPTFKIPLTTTPHRSLDVITCKATEVSQQSSVASASSGEDGKNWVPVVPLSALPKGERRVIIQDGETILLLWYKDDVFAIENRSPAEGAYSEGLLNAKLTQDGCIVCPTTDSTFDLRTGEIKDWYPKNPVLRVLTPPLKTLFVYPVKTDGENIFISLGGGIKSDASAEIVFSGKAQPGFTATDVNVDEVRMVVDEELEGFGFTGKNELINGKAAIIGFLVLLDFELLTGKGLLKGTGFLDFIYSISNTLN